MGRKDLESERKLAVLKDIRDNKVTAFILILMIVVDGERISRGFDIVKARSMVKCPVYKAQLTKELEYTRRIPTIEQIDAILTKKGLGRDTCVPYNQALVDIKELFVQKMK